MREIRFRVWDRLQKLMLYQSDCHNNPDDKCLMLTLDGRLLDTAFDRNDDETDSCILMQYSGFRDKNGKEIYEEDIIYTNDGYEKSIVKFGKYREAVDFYDHRNGKSIFQHSYIQDHFGFYLEKYYSFDGRLECLPITYIELHSSEIISNIHENPELLNEDKKIK